MKNRFRLGQRFNFFLERQFVKGAHYQLLFVAALIGLISLFGGLLVLPTGEPLDDLSESIWWAFLRLSDPGYLGDDEGAWRRFISTIITVAGYVVFLGALVAIITTWLHGKMRDLEQGLTPVTAENHILILGWTNRTIPIASELFQSSGRVRRFLKRYGTRNLQLIILANEVNPQRLQELKDDHMLGNRANEIILRSGTAIDREDLERVDSYNAAAIIIPSHSTGPQDLISSDVETIKTLLTLNENPEIKDKNKLPLVVAEIQDEKKRKAAHRAYSGPLEVIASDAIISRLIAQNIRHPGLSDIYNELLSRSVNNNLFVREYPDLVGKPLAKLKNYFPKSVVIGIVRWEDDDFVPYLNMPADFVMEVGDRLVLLTRTYEDTEMKSARTQRELLDEKVPQKNKLPVRHGNVSKKILILGWNHRIPALINEFSTYKEENYLIDVVSKLPASSRENEIDLLDTVYSQLECNHIESDFVTETELRRINPGKYDNIILASSDRLGGGEEADARSIVAYILLEDILEQEGMNPHILLELTDPHNETLVSRYKREVIISPMILSHLLAQVALRRELHAIYNELFTVGGAEIIFRKPREYSLENSSISFSRLEEVAAEHAETAMGIYYKNTGPVGKRRLIMNPHREQKLDLSEDVRLVVMITY